MNCPRCKSENVIVTGTMIHAKDVMCLNVIDEYKTYDCLNCGCWYDDSKEMRDDDEL